MTMRSDISSPLVVVAGHACIDIAPQMPDALSLKPGTLTRIGPAVISPGGAVSNVGIALHRLGTRARLIAQIGDDEFGKLLASAIAANGQSLDARLMTTSGGATSYSIVIAPPGRDRLFWHCSGVNDSFNPADVADDVLDGAAWLHFGYPPVMRYAAEHPAALAALFSRARANGLKTSLDFCSVDPASDIAAIDWRHWLEIVLPTVDFLVPSLDEMAAVLKLPTCADEVAATLMALGARAVVLKLGERGLRFFDSSRTLHQPALRANVVSGNGAGDAAIAGLIAALTNHKTIDEALALAAAAGAAACESLSATAAIPSIEALLARLDAR